MVQYENSYYDFTYDDNTYNISHNDIISKWLLITVNENIICNIAFINVIFKVFISIVVASN
jgi:hypothetical protein